MSLTRTLLLALATVLAPAAASAYELEVELVPGDPPMVVPLPPSVSADDVVVEPIEISLETRDPTPQPATRTFFAAGRPFEVRVAAASQPIRVRRARVNGQVVLLLEAERLAAEGEVAAVVARLRATGRPGARGGAEPAPEGWPTMRPEPPRVLAIVTTGRIIERSGAFARYVAWREAGGYRVIVGTEEDWDHPVEAGPDRRAERIRAWLRQVRDEEGLGYVLLIGDPSPSGGSVPMQLTHPLSAVIPFYPRDLAEILDPVPTDHFYADLEGDWDVDRDGRYAEYPDDAEGLRWDADALVGRIPVYGLEVEPLDRVLEAIVAYETDPSPGWRHRALLPAAFIGFEGSPAPGGEVYEETEDGAAAAEPLREAILALDPDAEVLRFYEEAGIWPSSFEHERPLSAEDLVSEWSLGAGIVVAYGHGSTDGDYRAVWIEDWNEDGFPGWEEMQTDPFLTSDDSLALETAGRAFTFHAACENGWPEDPWNLAASLLRRGAIGSVGASRAAIGGDLELVPAPDFGDADTLGYAFAHLLLEGATAGEAMAYLRYGVAGDGWGEESGIPLNGYGWIGKLEYNLYGDPTVGLGRCTSDGECDDGSLCNGTGRCIDGYCAQGELVDCAALAEGEGPCMVGRCDPETGECALVPLPDGTACDDELYCTVDDACTAGLCGGEPRVCGEAPEGFEAVCDDDRQACLLEPLPAPDAGPEDAGDAGPEEPDAAPLSRARGGGCSAVAAPARLPALLRALL